MLEKLLDSPYTILLNKSMDAANLRHTVISDNMANINTPDFKRREVLFEEKLQKSIQNSHGELNMYLTNKRHISIQPVPGNLEPEINVMEDLSYRNDGNNVDIDVESGKLLKNSIYYSALTQSMNNEIKLLRLAITGRE